MRVLFVGYGSIAKRHIKNLRVTCARRKINLEIDLLRHVPSPRPEGITATYMNASSLSGMYDAIFVTNPTSMHYDTVITLLDLSDCFFIEKPVFDRTDVDLKPLTHSDKLFYVACPLRYSSTIRWVKENIDFSSVISIRCISSSYLPDWRPGQDYRKTYSAHASMGGGVHIDLIHEWDYIVSLIGVPKTVKSIICKRSSLEIDSPDTAIYIADYGDKTVELHLDYFGRTIVRRMEIITNEETIICDIANGFIEYLRSGRCVNLKEERNDFQILEMEHFIDIYTGKDASNNTIDVALAVLSIAKGEKG